MIVIATVLLVMAFLLIFLELVIPSFGTIALASAACFAVSVFLAFQHSAFAGFLFVGIILAGVPVAVTLAVKLFKKSPLGKRMILAGPSSEMSGGGAGPEDLTVLVGKTGTAKTVLRPSGIAIIDGKRVDVVTEGRMIEPGQAVTVILAEGNRVVVRAADPADSADATG